MEDIKTVEFLSCHITMKEGYPFRIGVKLEINDESEIFIPFDELPNLSNSTSILEKLESIEKWLKTKEGIEFTYNYID